MKTDDVFWTDLRAFLSEMERVKPTLEPRPGRMAWLKRIILQLLRPLGVPQMDFNKQLGLALDRLVTAGELFSQRLDTLEASHRKIDAALEKLIRQVQSLAQAATLAEQGKAGTDAAVRRGESPPRSTNSAESQSPVLQAGELPDRPRTMLEAVERGFYLQNICPGTFNVLDEIENWDVLMILDACRYDAFERVWDQVPRGMFSGQPSKRISLGSHTVTWLKKTFRDRSADAARIVYLATNPHVSRRYLAQMGLGVEFAHVEELFMTCWDSRERTVMPDLVAKEYLRLRDRFPGKKFILHFLQPHSPFVGKTRIRTLQQPDMPCPVNADGVPLPGPTDLALIEDCQVSLEDGLKAYDDNLRMVLDVIAGLLPGIPGPVAITADHGELFGEYGIYGHVEEMYVPELIEVPYVLCSNGARTAKSC